MNQQQVSQDEMVQAVYGYAAQLMREGHSNSRVEQALVDRSVPADAAHTIVRQLDEERSRQYSKLNRDAALRNMAIGGVICAIGLVISIGSYQAAASSPSGGSYVVAWGAVIFGGYQFLRGFFALAS